MAGIISRVSEEKRAQILKDNIKFVLESLNENKASQGLIKEIKDKLLSMTPDEIKSWAEDNKYCIESTFMYDDAQALSKSNYVEANARLVIIAQSLDIDYYPFIEEKFENKGLETIFKDKIDEAAKRRLEDIETLVDFRNSER